MVESNVISISKAPNFQTHETRSTSSSSYDSILDTLRKSGMNPGMVSKLEIYREAGGGRTIKTLEGIVGQWLECEADVILQALASKHGGEYKLLHDKFLAAEW